MFNLYRRFVKGLPAKFSDLSEESNQKEENHNINYKRKKLRRLIWIHYSQGVSKPNN